MVPQFADLDRDGDADLVSGSWDGEITFFARIGKMDFAPGQTLKFADGKLLHEDNGSSPAFTDLDGDGDLDAIISWKNGKVKRYLNTSTSGMASFGPGVEEQFGGKPISTSDGRPVFADWNGDKIPDLIIGSDGQGITLYRGSRNGKTLVFGKGESLVKTTQDMGWSTRKAKDPKTMVVEPAGIGARPAPTVADWNGDGKLDLLVGDFTMVEREGKKLTSEETKKLAEMEKQYEDLLEASFKVAEKLTGEALKAIGKTEADLPKLTPEEEKKFTEAYIALMEKNTEYIAATEKADALRTEISKLKPEPISTGFVWVYLRK